MNHWAGPVTSTLLTDAVLCVTLLEGLLLLLWHRATGRGVAPRDFLPNWVAGLCLMAALACVVRDADASWVALCLLAAGLAHGVDVGLRWRRGRVVSWRSTA